MTCEVRDGGREVVLRNVTFGDVLAVIGVWLSNGKELCFTRPEGEDGEDAEVVFEVDDDFEPDSVTENKYGWRTAHIDSKLKPTFICECSGDCRIELGKDDE